MIKWYYGRWQYCQCVCDLDCWAQENLLICWKQKRKRSQLACHLLRSIVKSQALDVFLVFLTIYFQTKAFEDLVTQNFLIYCIMMFCLHTFDTKMPCQRSVPSASPSIPRNLYLQFYHLSLKFIPTDNQLKYQNLSTPAHTILTQVGIFRFYRSSLREIHQTLLKWENSNDFPSKSRFRHSQPIHYISSSTASSPNTCSLSYHENDIYLTGPAQFQFKDQNIKTQSQIRGAPRLRQYHRKTYQKNPN